MASKANRVQATAINTADATIKSSEGRVFWITVTNTHASDTAAIELDDGGTDLWGIIMGDIDTGSGPFHAVFDPPMQFDTSIIIDITGGTVTTTVGYE